MNVKETPTPQQFMNGLISTVDMANAIHCNHTSLVQSVGKLIGKGVIKRSDFVPSMHSFSMPYGGGYRQTPCYFLTYKGVLTVANLRGEVNRSKLINLVNERMNGNVLDVDPSHTKCKPGVFDDDSCDEVCANQPATMSCKSISITDVLNVLSSKDKQLAEIAAKSPNLRMMLEAYKEIRALHSTLKDLENRIDGIEAKIEKVLL